MSRIELTFFFGGFLQTKRCQAGDFTPT